METKKVKYAKKFIDDYIAAKQSQVNFINKYFTPVANILIMLTFLILKIEIVL